MTILVVGVAVPTPGAIGGFHAAYQLRGDDVFRAPTGSRGRRGHRAARDFVRPGHDSRARLHGARGAHAGGARSWRRKPGERRVAPDLQTAAPAPGERAAQHRPAHLRGGHRGSRRRAMKCPYCGHLGDKVVDSRESKEGEVIRRRRRVPRLRPPLHQLRADRRNPVHGGQEGRQPGAVRAPEADRRPAEGLREAAGQRPALEAIADRVEAELQDRPEREMTTEEIGARRDAGAQAARPGRVRPVRVGLPAFPRPRRVQARTRRASEVEGNDAPRRSSPALAVLGHGADGCRAAAAQAIQVTPLAARRPGARVVRAGRRLHRRDARRDPERA